MSTKCTICQGEVSDEQVLNHLAWHHLSPMDAEKVFPGLRLSAAAEQQRTRSKYLARVLQRYLSETRYPLERTPQSFAADRTLTLAMFPFMVLGFAVAWHRALENPKFDTVLFYGALAGFPVIVSYRTVALRWNRRPSPRLAPMGFAASVVALATAYLLLRFIWLPGRPLRVPGEGIWALASLVPAFGTLGLQARTELSMRPWCDRCARYLTKKSSQKREVADVQEFDNLTQAAIASGFSRDSVIRAAAQQAALARSAPSQRPYQSTIAVWHCTGCRRHLVRFRLEAKSHEKNETGILVRVEGTTDEQIDL